MDIKNGFIIKVKKEEAEKLRDFVKSVSGLDLINLDPLFNYDRMSFGESVFLQLSEDFSRQTILRIHGWAEHCCYGNRSLSVDEFINFYRDKYITMKDVVIVKHIPHSSLDFPKELPSGGITNLDQKYNLKMADIGIDYLFKDIKGIEITAPYSRLFCDVEKYKDNSKEEMAKYGQGYIYEKYYDAKTILRLTKSGDISIKDFIDEYYDCHHKMLNDVISSLLREGKRVLILDLHSYSDEQAIASGKEGPFPDICIGINDDYCNKDILDLIIRRIEAKGYTYKINYPYKGSILPNGLINKEYDGDVTSIMLEVNKRVYL